MALVPSLRVRLFPALPKCWDMQQAQHGCFRNSPLAGAPQRYEHCQAGSTVNCNATRDCSDETLHGTRPRRSLLTGGTQLKTLPC